MVGHAKTFDLIQLWYGFIWLLNYNLFVDLDHEFQFKFETDKSIIRKNACQVDRVKTTLKQIMRDWSAYGKSERDKAYVPVIKAIESFFGVKEKRVLVPGCGLGRLVYDLANLGFHCVGNEFSLFMIFASSFIINKCTDIGPNSFQYRIYPFIHEKNNILNLRDIETEISFPDINIGVPNNGGSMSIGMGDFLDIYTEQEWDCIATVFFIDTAHNIADYIERIYYILRPGGLWVNNGPLLYHFSNQPGQESVELCWEEVKSIIIELGFIIHEERIEKGLTYTQNQKSLLQYNYDTVFFTAKKP